MSCICGGNRAGEAAHQRPGTDASSSPARPREAPHQLRPEWPAARATRRSPPGVAAPDAEPSTRGGAARSPAATFIGVERTPAHTSGGGGGEGKGRGEGGVWRRRFRVLPGRCGKRHGSFSPIDGCQSLHWLPASTLLTPAPGRTPALTRGPVRAFPVPRHHPLARTHARTAEGQPASSSRHESWKSGGRASLQQPSATPLFIQPTALNSKH